MDEATFDGLQANFEQLCRFCASDGEVFPIFVEPKRAEGWVSGEKVLNEDRNIDVLLTQGYVIFNPQEGCQLPKFICDDCIDGLQRWHQLRQRIEQTTKLFGEFLEHKAQQIANAKDVLEETTEEFYLVEYLNEKNVNSDASNEIVTRGDGSLYERDTDGDESVLSSEERSDNTKPKATNNRGKHCPICGVLVKAKMKHHLMRHADPTGQPFKCDQCDKCYSFKPTLVNHVHQAHENVKYMCDQCGKQCTSKEILRIHKKLHNVGELHSCKVCGKTFRQHIYLKKHMVMHDKVLKYSCKYCSKQFRFKPLLMQHYRVHTGEKPYLCEFCNKTFRSITNQRQHRLTHLEEKPYKCVHCDSTYRSKRSLDRHNLIHRSKSDQVREGLVDRHQDQIVDVRNAHDSAGCLAVG